LNCHQGQHGKTWTDPDQCDSCHQAGVAAPMFPNTHDPSWNCYLCHAKVIKNCSPIEPHAHVYAAPADCVGCHLEASTANPGCDNAHHQTENCITCHGANKHGQTFISKDQCLVCH
jgi:hypothetical protein